MDVFSSALKNPLPPARKKSEPQQSEPTSTREALSKSNFEHDEATSIGSAFPPTAPEIPSSYESQTPSHDSKKKNSRRRHRNSHLGCGICKKRRIKCDEHLPQCFNCLKGRLHCAYLNLDAPARNALRLAQHNQNLRDDREEDASTKRQEKVATRVGVVNSLDNQPPNYSSATDARGEPHSDRKNHLAGASSRKLSTSDNPRPPSSACPPPVSQTMMQPMYMPYYQVQPVNHAMPYTQLPMHIVSGQHPQHVFYQAEQVPMQYASPQLAHAPASGPGVAQYMYNPQPSYGAGQPYGSHLPNGHMMPQPGQYVPTPVMPENTAYYTQPVPTPHISVAASRTSASKTSSTAQMVTHPNPSTSISPIAYPKAAIATDVPSIIQPDGHSSGANGSKHLSLPSTASQSNSASSKTSPSLPSITRITTLHDNTPVKLAPIDGGAEHVKQERDGAQFASNENEKISSIKMLLS